MIQIRVLLCMLVLALSSITPFYAQKWPAHDTTALEYTLQKLYRVHSKNPDSVYQETMRVLATAGEDETYAKGYGNYLLQTLATLKGDSAAYFRHHKEAQKYYLSVNDSMGYSFTLHQYGNYLVLKMALDSA